MLLFQVVTLPVEFNASNRAKALIVERGIIAAQEREGVDRVLNATALTYVAAAGSTRLTLSCIFSGGRTISEDGAEPHTTLEDALSHELCAQLDVHNPPRIPHNLRRGGITMDVSSAGRSLLA